LFCVRAPVWGGLGGGGGGGGGPREGGEAACGDAMAGSGGLDDDGARPKLLVAVEVTMTALVDCAKCGCRLPPSSPRPATAPANVLCPKCSAPAVQPQLQPPVTHAFPPSDLWDVLVLIVGVRDLKSPSLLPLFKPHVTVTCLGQSQQTNRSATPSAASPNYFQVLRIRNVAVSREPSGLLAPLLSLSVHERPLLPRWSGGGGDAVVGSVSMSLAEFLPLIPLHSRLAMRTARCGALQAPPPPSHQEGASGGAISISSTDVAVKLEESGGATPQGGGEGGEGGARSRRRMLVCAGGYSQLVDEGMVAGGAVAKDAQEEFLKVRQKSPRR